MVQPFASDGVSPIGGVPEVGSPPVADYIAASIVGGVEPSRYGSMSHGHVPMFGTRPVLQIEVEHHAWQRPSERAPGLSGIFGRAIQSLANFLQSPQPTRGGNIRTVAESSPFNSGMPNNHPDGERRGLTFEPAGHAGIVAGDTEGLDIIGAADVGPQPVINVPCDGMTDDVTEQVQSFPTNEFESLQAYRHSFTATYDQSPAMSRSVVLQQIANAGLFQGELSIPDGAVMARITWTNAGQIDLWWSTSSMAFVPSATVQAANGGAPTQSGAGNDGALLNPDSQGRYYVKGKRALSFCTNEACTVSVSFYMQA